MRAFLFLMDYAHQRRIKIWGRARISDDPQLVERLMPDGYQATGQQAILFRLERGMLTCPRYIPQKFAAADVAEVIARYESRICGSIS